MRRCAAGAAVLALCAAGPALAQPVAQDADPIGAMLEQAPAPTPAPRPYTPQPYNPPPSSAPPAQAYAPPTRPRATSPVHIDEVGRSPEPEPTYIDLNYEARLRASFNSAQGMKGPLDGSWRLSAAGDGLYDLQLVDNGAGALEGVWRDLRRPGAIDGTGFVTNLARIGTELTFRFSPPGAREPASVVLTASAGGGWSGDLIESGRRRGVTLQRN